jgi:hypothetical protein
MLDVDLAGDVLDEILLRGDMQVAAWLDRVTGSVGALLDARRCASGETKLAIVRNVPVSSHSTKRALPPSAMT